jgi:hypothetical protein
MSFSIPSMSAFIKNISSITASTLLLHFDGTNGQTTTSDSSVNSIAITMNSYLGTVALSSMQKKFGATAIATTGSNIGYITFPNSSLFDFSNKDWTIDFWWYPVTIPTTSAAINYAHFNTSFIDGSTTIPGILIRRNSRFDGGEFRILLSTDGSTQTEIATTYGLWTINTWYHIAFERHGSNINFYVDGQLYNLSTTFSGSLYYSTINPICFGGGFMTTFSQSNYTESYYDEFRIINGTAMYKGNSFTPSSSAYTS